MAEAGAVKTWLLLTAVVALKAAGPESRVTTPSGFEDFARRYRDAAPNKRADLAQTFIEERRSLGGFPIVESDNTVVFLYVGQGTEQNVSLVGDFRTRSFNSPYWNEAGESLSRIVPDAPVFFRRMKIEPDARLDYQFAVDGKYALDVLNRRTLVSGAAPSRGGDGETASELVMPGYRSSPATAVRDDVQRGRVSVIDEPWATPRVTIYLPPGYDAARKYPVVYTADGRQWRDFMGLPTILDNLAADRTIEPVIAVMIDSAKDRNDWYLFNPAYLEYVERVVDYVDRHYSTRVGPQFRLHVGSSAGGRVGLYVGLERPGLFSDVALMSPSLTAPPHYYEPYFSGRKRPDRRLKVWLSAGTYEGYIHADTQLMERYLRKAGLSVKAVYTHEGHSFGAWRNLAPAMLAHFFPPKREKPAQR